MRRMLVLVTSVLSCLALIVGALVSGATSLATAAQVGAAGSGQPRASAGHLDEAPPGVDARQQVSTAALIARSGVRTQPSRFRSLQRATGRTRAGVSPAPVSVLSVPGGTAVLGGLGSHVSPSCTGTTDGSRVQVLYVREAGTPSRYATLLPALQSFVADVDDTFALSSPGSGRRVRWVQDASCVPVIPEAVVPDGTLRGDTGVTALGSVLAAAGYGRADRKYLALADEATVCGVGEMFRDDSPAATNHNNGGAATYARVDSPCWASRADYHSTPAHELMHMLGGVQPTAPHATTYGHCTDEFDAMCYDDGSGQPVTNICTAPGSEAMFDCAHDDYFDERDSGGGYLASAWNTAHSSFLDVVPALSAAPVSPAVPTTSAPTTPAPTTPAPITPAPTTPAPITTPVPTPVPLVTPMTAAVTVSAPSRVLVGEVMKVTVRVTAGNVPVATAVTLQTVVSGVWRQFASGGTSTSGTVTFALRPPTAAVLTIRAVVPATPAISTAVSSPVTVRVVRRPTSTVSSLRAGRPAALTVTVRSSTGVPVSSQRVTLQARGVGSLTWRTVTLPTTDRAGQASVSVRPARPTIYRWVYSGSSQFSPSASGMTRVG